MIISGFGGPNTHPAPLEALQRMRLMLLGKHANDLIKNPSVRLESNDEDNEEFEQVRQRLALENDVYLASQKVTSDATVTTIEIDAGHEDINVEPPTAQELYDKKISCSYQVILICNIYGCIQFAICIDSELNV